MRTPLGTWGNAALLGFLVVLVAIAPLAVVGATYSMSVTGSTDIPDRTITVEGSDYLVSRVGQVQQGESISVTVDAPSGQSYDVYLYNAQIQIEQSESLTGDGTATFSTSNLQPSTYLAAVYYDGEIRKLTPVIVAGYRVSAEAPRSVERGERIQVSVSIDRTASSTEPAYVQVVVGDDQSAVRVNATTSSDGYVASVPTDSLPAGEYAIFAVARDTNETKYGRDVLLAMSNRQPVAVTDSTPTATDSQQSTGGTTSGTWSPPAQSTPSPTPSPTKPPATQTFSPTTTPTTSPTPARTMTSTGLPGTPTPASAGKNVITPGDDAIHSPTETGGQSGFGLLSAGLALSVAVLVIRRN